MAVIRLPVAALGYHPTGTRGVGRPRRNRLRPSPWSDDDDDDEYFSLTPIQNGIYNERLNIFQHIVTRTLWNTLESPPPVPSTADQVFVSVKVALKYVPEYSGEYFKYALTDTPH